jgi:peptide/nickel transport system substrate-binding protein
MSFRRLVTTGVVAGTLVVGLTAVSASGAAVSRPKVSGTIVFAEGAGANPNYIFPYMSCSYFSVANINQFEELMYRPLYWFGLGGSTAVQVPLSIASALPKVTGGNKTVTINLKSWKFSNGQTTDNESVAFFLNMYKADPGSYCGYNGGFGIPDKLGSVTYVGGLAGHEAVLHFTTAVNPNWILYNYLSEITPFPEAWDKTTTGGAAGSGGCAAATYGSTTAHSKCLNVEHFLDAQSGSTGTYTGALWGVVDGPWKLSAYDSLGNATFVPNNAYSGPVHAQVAQVKEKAYTSTGAEESDLATHAVQLGYVDPSVLPGDAPKPGSVGPNVAAYNSYYKLTGGSPWSFNYAPFNLAASDPKHAAMNQLYIRTALNQAVNQAAILKSVNKGYGYVTCSPIPPNTPTKISAKIVCPYPYNATKAKALLTSHGWKIEGGVQTCTSATACGAGIGVGYKLNLKMIYNSGFPSEDSTVAAEISEWAAIGISVSKSTSSFDAVIGECNGGTFQMCWWGGGWIYAPDYYPSGETLLDPTGSFDVGNYNNPEMNSLITATTQGKVNLTAYGKYAAQQVPELWEPNPSGTGELARNIKFSTAAAAVPDPLENFMPEYMHY